MRRKMKTLIVLGGGVENLGMRRKMITLIVLGTLLILAHIANHPTPTYTILG